MTNMAGTVKRTVAQASIPERNTVCFFIIIKEYRERSEN